MIKPTVLAPAGLRQIGQTRLILTAPPQHGKSELISRRLPAFGLGRNPNLQIIATSYSADRAFDFSANLQQIMDAEVYHAIFPNTRIVGKFAKLGEAKRTAGLFESPTLEVKQVVTNKS